MQLGLLDSTTTLGRVVLVVGDTILKENIECFLAVQIKHLLAVAVHQSLLLISRQLPVLVGLPLREEVLTVAVTFDVLDSQLLNNSRAPEDRETNCDEGRRQEQIDQEDEKFTPD